LSRPLLLLLLLLLLSFSINECLPLEECLLVLQSSLLLLLGRLLCEEHSLLPVDIDEEDLMDRKECTFFTDLLISFF
jgi:hypothetical protein